LTARGKGRRRFPGRRIRRSLVLGLPFLFLLFLAALCLLPRGSGRPAGEARRGKGRRAGLLSEIPKERKRGKDRTPERRASWRLADERGRGWGGIPLVVWAGGEAYPARTDPEGRFPGPPLRGEERGTWWGLEAELPGGAEIRRLIRSALSPRTLRIPRDFRSLEGVLLIPRPGGAPAEAFLQVLELPQARELAALAVKGGRRWTCLVPQEVPPGALLLQARAGGGGFLGAWFPEESEEPQGGPLRLPAGPRPVEVIFSPGPPPEGSRLAAAPRFFREPFLVEAAAGGERKVDLSLPPGPWQVILLGPRGRLLAEGRVRAGRDRILRLRAASPKGEILEGRVLEPGGGPARGARVVFFPSGVKGREAPLPPREEWNPFLAARVRRETRAGKDGSFRLRLGPWTGGTLQVSSDPPGARRTLVLESFRPLPGPIRLRKAAALEIGDLRLRKGRHGGVLEGELELLLERKGGAGFLRARILCLPWRSPSLEPGTWVLRLEAGGVRARGEAALAPGRILRLTPLLEGTRLIHEDPPREGGSSR